MEGAYIILAGLVIVAIWAFIISYREDHPKKNK
jgi:hypothetical protein